MKFNLNFFLIIDFQVFKGNFQFMNFRAFNCHLNVKSVYNTNSKVKKRVFVFIYITFHVHALNEALKPRGSKFSKVSKYNS